MSGYDVNHSPALEGCRDRCARLEAENAELRAALEGLVPVALALITDLAASGFDLSLETVTAIAEAHAALAASEGES